MMARVSMLLKSRASLACFGACFLPGRAKDLSAPGVIYSVSILCVREHGMWRRMSAVCAIKQPFSGTR